LPSQHPKVTQDTPPLLLAYEWEKTLREDNAAFVPTHWKLIALEYLEVDQKFKSNQSNRSLYGKYGKSALLSEGKAKN
jgi:hypothetical protein